MRASVIAAAATLSLAATVVTTAEGEARADCGDPTYQTCLDANTFAPYGLKRSFATVSDSSFMRAGELRTGALGTYASRPLVLESVTTGTTPVVDHLLITNVGASFAPISGAALELSLPITLHQDGASNPVRDSSSELDPVSVRDGRIGVALSLLPLLNTPPADDDEDEVPIQRRHELVVRAGTSAPLGSTLSFEGEGRFSPYADVAFSEHIHRLTLAASAGTHIRTKTVSFGGYRHASDLEGAFGASFDFLSQDRLTGMLESRLRYDLVRSRRLAFTSLGVESDADDRLPLVVEAVLGARTTIARRVGITGSFGLPITAGSARLVPAFRAMLGVSITFDVALPGRSKPVEEDEEAATPATPTATPAADGVTTSPSGPAVPSAQLDASIDPPPPPPPPPPPKNTKKKPKPKPKAPKK